MPKAPPFLLAFALAFPLSGCQEEGGGAVSTSDSAEDADSSLHSIPSRDGAGEYCFEGMRDPVASSHQQRRIRATDTLASGRYSVRAWDTLVTWSDARFVPLPTDPFTATVIVGDSALVDVPYSSTTLQPLLEERFPLFVGEDPVVVRYISCLSATGSGIAVVSDSVGLVFASSSWSSRSGGGSRSYFRRSWNGHGIDADTLRARVDSVFKHTGYGAFGGWGAVDMCSR